MFKELEYQLSFRNIRFETLIKTMNILRLGNKNLILKCKLKVD